MLSTFSNSKNKNKNKNMYFNQQQSAYKIISK